MLLVCAAQLVYCQVVNDYINPFWVTGKHYTSDRRILANPVYSGGRQYPAENRDRCQLQFYNNKNQDDYDYIRYLIDTNRLQHVTNVNGQQPRRYFTVSNRNIDDQDNLRHVNAAEASRYLTDYRYYPTANGATRPTVGPLYSTITTTNLPETA